MPLLFRCCNRSLRYSVALSSLPVRSMRYIVALRKSLRVAFIFLFSFFSNLLLYMWSQKNNTHKYMLIYDLLYANMWL